MSNEQKPQKTNWRKVALIAAAVLLVTGFIKAFLEGAGLL